MAEKDEEANDEEASKVKKAVAAKLRRCIATLVLFAVALCVLARCFDFPWVIYYALGVAGLAFLSFLSSYVSDSPSAPGEAGKWSRPDRFLGQLWFRLGSWSKPIWALEHLWFPVFVSGALVGLVDAHDRLAELSKEQFQLRAIAIDLHNVQPVATGPATQATQSVTQPSAPLANMSQSPPAIRWWDSRVLTVMSRDLVIAAFLAVITAVISATFTDTDTTVQQLKRASDRIDRAREEFKAISETVIGKLHNTSQLLVRSSDVADQASRAMQVRALLNSLATAAAQYVDLGDVVKGYHKAFFRLENAAILPLVRDYIGSGVAVEVALARLNADLTQDQVRRRCAVMTAALQRYFELESEESHYPGVVLGAAAFGCYAQAVASVVKALEPWRRTLEFYTLMPKPPHSLFSFTNSIQLKQWLTFLDNYHTFQVDTQTHGGVWNRFFAHVEKADKRAADKKTLLAQEHRLEEMAIRAGFRPIREIAEHMQNRIVYCESGKNWLPQPVSSDADRDALIAALKLPSAYTNDAKSENPLHGGQGTLVVRVQNKGNYSAPWVNVLDALDALQVSQDSYRFVAVNEYAESFASTGDVSGIGFRIRQQKLKEDGNYEDGQTASLHIPPDFFAVRSTDAEVVADRQWKYLIGLVEGASDTRVLDRKLAMFVMLDLDSMSAQNSGPDNQATAQAIRELLTKVFRKKNAAGNDALGGVEPSQFYTDNGIK